MGADRCPRQTVYWVLIRVTDTLDLYIHRHLGNVELFRRQCGMCLVLADEIGIEWGVQTFKICSYDSQVFLGLCCNVTLSTLILLICIFSLYLLVNWAKGLSSYWFPQRANSLFHWLLLLFLLLLFVCLCFTDFSAEFGYFSTFALFRCYLFFLV